MLVLKGIFILSMFLISFAIIPIFKIILTGFKYEGLVGSMSYGGGGPAVVIPLAGLIFYWLTRNGKFSRRDWIAIILLLIIAIASGKRQPRVFYPVILLALFVFVSKSIRSGALIKFIPITLIFFYAILITN